MAEPVRVAAALPESAPPRAGAGLNAGAESRPTPVAPAVSRRWPAAAAVAAAVLAVIALYGSTAAAMVDDWWARDGTYAHGFAVAPISAWLAWRLREALALTPMRPFYPALAALALAGAVWLVADAGSVIGVMQLALMVMVQMAILAVGGIGLVRLLFFPWAFLLFAVPIGEFLVPPMMDLTADFTIAAIRLSGVPVYREGNFFVLPTGSWSVVEACSGVRYLIAGVMVGCLYAYLMYRSAAKRLLFAAVSVAVPVVANWLRAYLIVMLGHLSDNRLATGVDHVIYGWLFFGIVIAIVFWIGSFWREDDPGAGAPVRADGAAAPRPNHRSPLLAAGAVAVVAGLWPAAAGTLASATKASLPGVPAVAAPQGWLDGQEGALPEWTPAFANARAVRRQTFVKGGQPVAMFIAYYRNQVQGNEMVTSTNALVNRRDQQWRQVPGGNFSLEWRGASVSPRVTDVVGPGVRFRALLVYWIDGRVTASDYLSKALLVRSKLSGRGDDSAAIILYTPTGDFPEEADARLQAFVAEFAPGIEAALATAAGS